MSLCENFFEIYKKKKFKRISLNLLRFPFNWRTPFGYLIAFFSQTVTFFCCLQYCSGVLCSFYGFCWILMAFGKDITREWIEINNIVVSPKDLKRKIIDIIRFHSKVKQLSRNTSKIKHFCQIL